MEFKYWSCPGRTAAHCGASFLGLHFELTGGVATLVPEGGLFNKKLSKQKDESHGTKVDFIKRWLWTEAIGPVLQVVLLPCAAASERRRTPISFDQRLRCMGLPLYLGTWAIFSTYKNCYVVVKRHWALRGFYCSESSLFHLVSGCLAVFVFVFWSLFCFRFFLHFTCSLTIWEQVIVFSTKMCGPPWPSIGWVLLGSPCNTCNPPRIITLPSPSGEMSDYAARCVFG